MIGLTSSWPVLFVSLLLALNVAVALTTSTERTLGNKAESVQLRFRKLVKKAGEASRAAWHRRLSTWESVTVNTSTGPIRGKGDENITAFLGVPFAAPPVGDLRWAPPMPHEPWTAPRNATWWGPACPQAAIDFYWGLVSGMSEDCLSLNWYVPSSAMPPPPSSASSLSTQQETTTPKGGGHNEGEEESKKRNTSTTTPGLPIAVFFYGGGFSMGSSDLIYDTVNDMIHGGASGKSVIWVTINYRVATMGFLGGSQLQNTSQDGSTGNWGLQDQIAALEYVKANAHLFGGDSSRVMIFGESAGGASVSLHMTNPKTWHLFQRAIIESGPVADWITQPFERANATYQSIAQTAGCPTDNAAASVACLRAKPWEYFTAREVGMMDPRFCPTIDNVSVPEDPFESLRRGTIAPVPVIAGTNRNEGNLFNSLPRNLTAAGYAAALRKKFGAAEGDAIFQQYPPSRFEKSSKNSFGNSSSAWQGYSLAMGDCTMNCPNRQMARAIATKANAPVYVYIYDHENALLKEFFPWLGVCHMSELLNVFDIRILLRGPGENRLAQMFISMWTHFAHAGTPNAAGSGYPEWAPFTKSNIEGASGADTSFAINTGADGPGAASENQRDLRKSDCDFWAAHGLHCRNAGR